MENNDEGGKWSRAYVFLHFKIFPYPKWHLREWFSYRHASSWLCWEFQNQQLQIAYANRSTRSMRYITACAYLTLPQVHLQQPALSTGATVRAVPRSIWSLSISTSSSPTTNHQVEEEATLLATPIASLTATLAMNFNEVQRRGIRNDASLSPTPFHWTTSTGPREAAWLPWTRSRSNHLSSSTVLGILQSLPISGPMLPIWAQFLFPGCVPSHSS